MGRKSISFPPDLEQRIATVAEQRKLSFSKAVVVLLDESTADQPLPYEGKGEGPGDLSMRLREYLDKLAEEKLDRR